MATSSNQDKMAMLQASVAGGPIAAKEYATKTAVQPDVVQQAISNAAANAGKIDAPAAFQQAQAQSISAPLTATVSQGQANAGAANAYQSALSSASNQYLGDVQQSYAPAEAALKQAAEGYDGYGQKALDDVRSRAASIASQARTQKNADDVTNKDFIASRKVNALQGAATDSNILPKAYTAISSSVGAADNADAAIDEFDAKYTTDPDTGVITDSAGNAINTDDQGKVITSPAQIAAYITQAFDQSSGVAKPGAVLQPGTPEYDAFMATYGGTSADGNAALGQ